MATLNVKNLSDALYRKIKARAKRHRRSVSQEITQILEQAVAETEPLSLLDLEGLGEELWKGIDPADHVERERDSWD